MSNSDDRFRAAIQEFDAANREDPNRELWQGKEYPKELLYAERMTQWLERLALESSEPLRLAVRCQHIRRWTIPRSQFPEGRRGYHDWRITLAGFHAREAGAILRKVGYDELTIQRVQDLVQKKHLKTDPETQLLEDVVCLVFLEYYFIEFSHQHDEEKLATILRKTWRKMSDRGHRAALELELPDEGRGLIERALG